MRDILNKKSVGLIIIVAIIVIAIFTYNNQRMTSNDKIVIGISAPLTGPTAWWGEYIKNGVKLAMEDLDKENIASSIELKWEDDQCSSQQGISAVNKLIYVDNAKYILGPLCNQVTIPTQNLFEKNKVISMETGLPNRQIAQMSSPHFSLLPEIGYFMKALVDYIYSHNDISKMHLAIIRLSDAYGQENFETFKQVFEDRGGKIVADETITSNSTDMKTQLTKIKASNPDSIMLITYGPNLIEVLKEMNQLGMNNLKKYGIVALESLLLLQTVPKLAEGVIYPVPTTKNNVSSVSDFKNRYKSEFGTANDVYSANAYDSLKILVSSIRSCGYDNYDCVTKKLLNINGYQGANGVLSVDSRGVANYDSIMIKTVKNGQFIPIE